MPNVDVDLLASKLYEWGSLAKSMPPAWDGACISHPLRGMDEKEYIGRILPGRGVYLDCDLKYLGIDKGIPHVYEKTIVRQASEAIARARNGLDVLASDERGAITSYNGIISARGAGQGQNIMVVKGSFVTVANVWSSVFQAGGTPGVGTYSSTPGSAPDNTNVGALSASIANPSGGNSQYLLTFGFTSASAINMVILVDLLSQVGSLSATVNTSQTVSSTAISRSYTGATAFATMMTFDVTTPIGTTASNLTVTYNNQGGSSKTTPAQAMTPSMIAQRIFPAAFGPFMQLASGDYGVQSVASLQLSAAMSAGAYALNLSYPLMFLPGIVANIYVERDSTVQIDGIQQLVASGGGVIGCVTAYIQPTSTTSGLIVGAMRTVQG